MSQFQIPLACLTASLDGPLEMQMAFTCGPRVTMTKARVKPVYTQILSRGLKAQFSPEWYKMDHHPVF